MKWPGQRRGRRVSGMVSLVDLYPTLLHVAGVPAPPSDGVRLTPKEGTERGFALFEEHAYLIHPLPRHLRIAAHLYGLQRSDRRHVVWSRGETCARRRNGGWETVPCAGDGPELLREIRAELRPVTAPEIEPEALPEELRESLEALGYL